MNNEYSSFRRYQILNLINRFGPISRTGLVELTDTRPASIGEITKELIDSNLVVESGHVAKGQGRRRLLLSINREYICAVTLAIRVTAVTFVVSQIDGRILKKVEHTEPAGTSMEDLSSHIMEVTLQLLREYSDRMIIGIGICDPLYDPARYQTHGSVVSGYENFNAWLHEKVKPEMEKKTGIPVSTFSPVTLPALAEKRFGAARDSQNFICVELSNGIGSSFCCNGQVVSGAHGVAGELGHTVIDFHDNSVCYCGKPGCVEHNTAFPALVRNIRNALRDGALSLVSTYHGADEPLTVADIRRALDQGDQMCRFYVRSIAREIGIAIANAVTLLNPDLVILYGFMTELGDYFIMHVENAIRDNVLMLSRNFRVVTSTTHESMHPLGAAAELFTDFLHMNDYRWIYDTQTDHPDQISS